MRAPWRRLLWGAQLDGIWLIGKAWADHKHPAAYVGEPMEPLLFTTRECARAWCAAQNDKYADRPVGDVCRAWRFRPVRVERIVNVISALAAKDRP